jgi:ABC-type sugar transport system ATPase subunit
MTAPLLDVRGVSKAFGATQALSDVSLAISSGEIHAIVGENGAGKSTLVNVLSGVLRPDGGTVELAGTDGRFDSPQAAQRLGIGTVHQELSLSELLSVEENIFAGRAPSRHGLIDWSELRGRALTIFERLELTLDPGRPVATLPVSSRQLVEIAKALSLDARLLLLDEPTTALNINEKEVLFRLLRRLRDRGIGIIYISHHLHEVMALADRITVMRDGRVVATHEASAVTVETLVKEMVGRVIDRSMAAARPEIGPPCLEVRELTVPDVLAGVSFTLHHGEILGIAGLLGSGRSELAACLAGLTAVDRGSILVDGSPAELTSLRHAMALGIGFLPPERKSDGLFLDLSVTDNIAAASLTRFSRFGVFNSARATAAATQHINGLKVHCDGPQARCGALSGGNQQKVLLAKWLERSPRVLIVQEPTKGVDIAAKDEIHRRLRQLAAEGMAIVFISSDLPEILTLSHRVLVMHRGRVAANLATQSTSEEEIIAHASGIARAAA